MTLNQIIDMIIRRVMSEVINRGMSAGINALSRPRASQTPADLERQAALEGQQAARKARAAAKLSGRIGGM